MSRTMRAPSHSYVCYVFVDECRNAGESKLESRQIRISFGSVESWGILQVNLLKMHVIWLPSWNVAVGVVFCCFFFRRVCYFRSQKPFLFVAASPWYSSRIQCHTRMRLICVDDVSPLMAGWHKHEPFHMFTFGNSAIRQWWDVNRKKHSKEKNGSKAVSKRTAEHDLERTEAATGAHKDRVTIASKHRSDRKRNRDGIE